MLPKTPKNFRKKLLQKLEVAWDKNPELRFAQLMVNVIKPKEPVPEIFYINNDDLMNKVNSWIERE